METKHLWEIDHLYYCCEEHYFGTGGCFKCGRQPSEVNSHFKSWDDFMSNMGDADNDYNLIFRWDWELPEDSKKPTDPDYRSYTLSLFYMMQRKGFHRVCTIEVCQSDEPKVREFLTAKWNHMRSLWEPIA